jgi:hypothetical protein
VLFCRGVAGAALMANVPGYSERGPNQGGRRQNENGIQNLHRGEDNKLGGGQESRSCFAFLERGFRANT